MATTIKTIGKLSGQVHKMYGLAAAAAEVAEGLIWDPDLEDEEREVIVAVEDVANDIQGKYAELEQRLIDVMEARRLRKQEPQPGDQLDMTAALREGVQEEGEGSYE